MANINYSQIVAKNFAASMLTLMKESVGGILGDLGEMRSITGAESTTFNRATLGTSVSTAPNLYNSGAQNTGGTYTAIEVFPSFEYAYEKVPEVKFRKSQVNLKGYIPKKLITMLEISEDQKVLDAIFAKYDAAGGAGKLNLAGDKTKPINDDANIQALIAAARGALVEAEQTPDKRSFVKMVMNKETYKAIFSSEKLINSDYIGQSNVNGGSTKHTFYGCEVVIIKQNHADLKKGRVLFVPSMTLGYAKWSSADATEAKYELANEDSWLFEAKKSFAAVCIEPESITLVEGSTT